MNQSNQLKDEKIKTGSTTTTIDESKDDSKDSREKDKDKKQKDKRKGKKQKAHGCPNNWTVKRQML